MTPLDDADIKTLYDLEVSLWRPETRFDAAQMEATLAPDFFEFGRSGRTYRRDETLAAEPTPFTIRLPLPRFDARLIAPDVALITYISDVDFPGGREVANRSSLWSREHGRWRIRFHQGTPTSV